MIDPSLTIRALVHQYLARHRITKLACFTNCLPEPDSADWPIDNFNYILFCMQDARGVSDTLFQAFVCGYRKVEFDVREVELESALCSRQFGYLYLSLPSRARAAALLSYISTNMPSINRSGSLFLRLRCPDAADLAATGTSTLEARRANDDVVLEVSR